MNPLLYKNISHRGKARSEHTLIAERALGKPLPKGVVVHHADGNRRNNANENLIICPDQAYHALLHARIRSYDATGHYDWLRCFFCGRWDAPENLRSYVTPPRNRPNAYHAVCNAANQAERRERVNGKDRGK